MKKTKIIMWTLISVLLLKPLMALSAFATTLPTFTLSGSIAQLSIALPSGTTFNGSISTTGTIRFWLSDPNGAQIVNLGLVDKDTTFGFVAQLSGNYTLNFENDLPNSNPVQVTFSYTTNPDISTGNNSTVTPLIYLLSPIIITIVGSVLIIFLVRRKSRKRT
jgi:hypothetical protein